MAGVRVGHLQIHIAMPAAAEYRRWAEITARSAQKGTSLPVLVHYADWPPVARPHMATLSDWHKSMSWHFRTALL